MHDRNLAFSASRTQKNLKVKYDHPRFVFLPSGVITLSIGFRWLTNPPYEQRSGQILATSHDLTPKWWFSKGNLLFQGNLGWWNIIIWPERWSKCSIRYTVPFFKARNETKGRELVPWSFEVWICWVSKKTSSHESQPFLQVSSDQLGPLVICCIEGMKYYPVIWGWNFISHEIRIPINQSGFNGTSTGFWTLLRWFSTIEKTRKNFGVFDLNEWMSSFDGFRHLQLFFSLDQNHRERSYINFIHIYPNNTQEANDLIEKIELKWNPLV